MLLACSPWLDSREHVRIECATVTHHTTWSWWAYVHCCMLIVMNVLFCIVCWSWNSTDILCICSNDLSSWRVDVNTSHNAASHTAPYGKTAARKLDPYRKHTEYAAAWCLSSECTFPYWILVSRHYELGTVLHCAVYCFVTIYRNMDHMLLKDTVHLLYCIQVP